METLRDSQLCSVFRILWVDLFSLERTMRLLTTCLRQTKSDSLLFFNIFEPHWHNKNGPQYLVQTSVERPEIDLVWRQTNCAQAKVPPSSQIVAVCWSQGMKFCCQWDQFLSTIDWSSDLEIDPVVHMELQSRLMQCSCLPSTACSVGSLSIPSPSACCSNPKPMGGHPMAHRTNIIPKVLPYYTADWMTMACHLQNTTVANLLVFRGATFLTMVIHKNGTNSKQFLGISALVLNFVWFKVQCYSFQTNARPSENLRIAHCWFCFVTHLSCRGDVAVVWL